MITILIALVASINTVALIVSFQMSERDRRAARLKELILRPNCLLTRYPLVFIEGRSSLFRLFNHWNNLPGFLREHGYEVMVLEPIALIGHPAGSAASLIAALDDLPTAAHLIADGSSLAELEAIADRRHPRVKSLTLIENPERRWVHSRSHRSAAASLKPLASAITPFEVKSRAAKPQNPLRQWVRLTLLELHNTLAVLRGSGTVDALEVGELSENWEIETQLLELAIDLAECDLRETPPSLARSRASVHHQDVTA